MALRRPLILFCLTLVLAPIYASTASEDRILQIIQAVTSEGKTDLAKNQRARPAEEKKPDPAPEMKPLNYQFLPLLANAGDMNAAPSLLPLVSSQNLADSHKKVTRAVIILHDADRNAAGAMLHLQALAGAVAGGGSADRTMIIAPMFPSAADLPGFTAILKEAAQHIALWEQGEWPYGGESILIPGQPHVSSMTALDVLLLYLADKQSFPILKDIVVAGYGKGGDLVQRYALYGRAPGVIAEQHLSPRYVVGAARSMAWLTNVRPGKARNGSFSVPDQKALADCPDYDKYPYGLVSAKAYAQQVAGNIARQDYAARDIVYAVSSEDSAAPDDHCAAQLQGKSIRTRTENYYRHIRTLFGDDALTHKLVVIPNAGDNEQALWESSCGISLLFSDGECINASENPE